MPICGSPTCMEMQGSRMQGMGREWTRQGGQGEKLQYRSQQLGGRRSQRPTSKETATQIDKQKDGEKDEGDKWRLEYVPQLPQGTGSTPSRSEQHRRCAA